MRTFATIREAKEFVISRIVMQSQMEGASLSDIERKMLYFSETGWTLPDMNEVSNAFDRDYDEASYEQKIGTLAHNFLANSHRDNRDEFEAWKEAIRTIRQEDHYLLVLIDPRLSIQPDTQSPYRFLKLLALGFLMACVLLVIGYFYLKR
ncbi:MAG: hypothetical protein JSS95_09745 [Acidobacteria bacterium]|nr:hypothetical protein [Acidobacteriota bacterium]